jgi:hypothetical protein
LANLKYMVWLELAVTYFITGEQHDLLSIFRCIDEMVYNKGRVNFDTIWSGFCGLIQNASAVASNPAAHKLID